MVFLLGRLGCSGNDYNGGLGGSDGYRVSISTFFSTIDKFTLQLVLLIGCSF